jgi:hypothetical protein
VKCDLNVVLSGLMASALANGTTVRGFNPGRGGWILRAIRIRSAPSFGGEIKPSAPSRKILRNVKVPYKYERIYFSRPNSSFSSSVFPALLLDNCW